MKLLREQNNKLNDIVAQQAEIIKLSKRTNCKKQSLINTQNSNNNTNSNNTVNIQLVAFGKEDLNKVVSDNVCKKLIDRGFKSIETLIEYIHFNENKPEFHNCYISNYRDKYAVVYDGNTWNLVDTHDVVDDLTDTKQEFLEIKFNELGDMLNENTKTKFNRFIDQKDDKKVKDSQKKNIKLILYNKRDIVKNTRKKKEEIYN